MLDAIAHQLGKGTSGLLSAAEPTRFEDGLLTLTFPASASMQKKMCESNGRVAKIESWLSEQFGKPVKIQLSVAEDETGNAKTAVRKKNELINDPAVKTVLLELDATITGIEED